MGGALRKSTGGKAGDVEPAAVGAASDGRPQSVADWNEDHVRDLLTEINLTAEIQRFVGNNVDGKLLLKFGKADLTGAPFNLEGAQAVILLHKIEPRRPCPEDERKVIRAMIFHENKLYDQRRSHFAVLQGFLFTASAVLMQSNHVLVYVLVAAGISVSVASWLSMKASRDAIQRLKKKIFPTNDGKEPDNDVGLPIIGLDSDQTCNPWCIIGLQKYPPFDIGCMEPNDFVVPLIFIICWAAFAGVLAGTANNSHPKEIYLLRDESVPILIDLVGK